MAIHSSCDWSLGCLHDCLSQKPGFNSPPKSLPFLSLLSSTSRFLSVNSSNCASPILEDQSSTGSSLSRTDLSLGDYRSSPEPEDPNGLICGLLDDPKTEGLGIEWYQKAKRRPDFKPETSTLKSVIRYLVNSNSWNSIWSVSQDFERFDVFPDSSSCCRLISCCIRYRRFKLANSLLNIFKGNEEIALPVFNVAIKGYNKLHMYSSAVAAFEMFRSSAVVLDAECYGRVMESYSKMGRNEQVFLLFREFADSGLDGDPLITQIYRILCDSLGKSGKPFEALEHFREMTSQGYPEDPSFYTTLICSFAAIKEVQMAEELLEEAEKKKMLRDPSVFLKFVLMYIEVGSIERTLDVVLVMTRVKTRVSDCIFCAILNGFSRKKGLNSAAKVYEELVSLGCEPGQVTYASILNVYFRIGLYSKAEEVFVEMNNKGFEKCVVAYSTMVAMYGKTGRVRDAVRLVAKMKEKGVKLNVWIYNSLLDAHGKMLNLRQVEKLWKEMKRRKLVPDAVSYTSLIGAYSKAREFERCVRYYREYRLNGGRIDRAMAGIMVGVFSKMSRVDELVKLLQDMKEEGTGLDARLFRSSLNAMRDAGLEVQAKWLQQSFDAA